MLNVNTEQSLYYPMSEGQGKSIAPHTMSILKQMLTKSVVHLAVSALDKQEYLVIIRHIFLFILHKAYVVTPHLDCLTEMIPLWGHNIWFQ